MPEQSSKSYSRKAKLEDFFDDDDKPAPKIKHEKTHTHNDTDTIEKNQQEYGNRKRIKP
jgi:hypothetical protein